jgi:hypothetical protein
MAQVYIQCYSAEGLLPDRHTLRALVAKALVAMPAPVIKLSVWSLALSGEVSRIWGSVLQGIRDPYRPELHYMRGPGPKYRAKHGLRGLG